MQRLNRLGFLLSNVLFDRSLTGVAEPSFSGAVSAVVWKLRQPTMCLSSLLHSTRTVADLSSLCGQDSQK